MSKGIGLLVCLLLGCNGAQISPEASTPAAKVTTLSGSSTFETIEFPSADGLLITADVYVRHPESAPFIVLCHQAGWSRGEYREIAPKLNALGFNCMSIDQRSGKVVNDVPNQTAQRAAVKRLPGEYHDALPDIRAALAYARKNYAQGEVLLWGSSYSAALALVVAATASPQPAGVLLFAPGEYFPKQGSDFVARHARKYTGPVFITSSKKEQGQWNVIRVNIANQQALQTFVPKTAGNHGSRALWAQFPDHGAYWDAVERFLSQYTP